MSCQESMNRKKFLTGVGQAFLGLGLGAAACGKAPESQAGQAQLSAAGGEEPPVTAAYRTLGKAKIKVSEIGYGASRTTDPSLIKYALDIGINFLDTGRSYSNGQNEVLVGKLVKGMRDKVVINSKLPFAEPERMRRDLEASLAALGTDYVDCMLIHGASQPGHINSQEVKEFLSRAKQEGKIRSFGFSSHSNFLALLDLAARDRFHEVIMVPYNFMGHYTHMLGGSKQDWDADALDKAIRKCGEAGIDFVAMKACSGGFLKDSTGPQTYRAALQWVLQNPYLKSTATAMGNFTEIEHNARAMGRGKLGAADLELLDRYAEAYGGWYCRMCSRCDGKCPQGVDVAQINRLHMYAVGYRGEMAREARRTYATLGTRCAGPCADCGRCVIECPYGLEVGRKMTAAHRLLG